MKKRLLASVFLLLSLFTFAQNSTKAGPYEKIYNEDNLDSKPEYPSGKEAYQKFISRNLHLPDTDKNVEGKIVIQFIVEADGTASHFTVLEDPDYRIGEEALRVTKKINQYWKPGILNGKTVPSYHTETITVSIRN